MCGRLKVVCAVAILCSSFAAVAQESNLNGRWTATLKKGDRTGTANLTVSVSGSGVTGTLSDPSGQIWQIENGKLEADRLTFDITAHEHGGTKNIHFFGSFADDAITLRNESRGRPGQIMTFHKIRD